MDLNSSYMDTNVKTDGQDYLQMVCAPDYNNLVTPSPHHYVNDSRSFFPPTPTQVPLGKNGSCCYRLQGLATLFFLDLDYHKK